MVQGINPFLIPIVFLIGAFAIGIVAMILNTKSKDRRHQERMYLAETGMDIPMELYEARKEEVSSRETGVRS